MNEENNSLYQLEGFERIFACSSFSKDYKKLYRKSKADGKRYSQWLHKQLSFLDEETTTMSLLNHPRVFEKIRTFSYEDEEIGIYSIRKPEFSKNPRIIFSAIGSDPDDIIVLLLAFSELKSNDYDRNIPVAIERMKYLLSGLKGE